MYRINRLTRPVLITIDEVIAKAVVDENADIRYLLNSIEVAEERYIAPALGDAMYEDMLSQKNVQVTSGNQTSLLSSINASLTAAGKQTIQSSDIPVGTWVNAIEMCSTAYQNLWNRFLWKIIAEAVDMCAVIPSWTRTTAQGQQQNNPKTLNSDSSGSATADRKDVEYKLDSMSQQRLYPLIARMKKWIVEQGGYPLFPVTKKPDGIDGQMKGGIIMGIYEDSNPNGPDMWQLPRFGGCDRKDRYTAPSAPATPTQPATLTDWKTIQIFIVATPDPNALIAVGPASIGKMIQAQYAPGATIKPMQNGDSAGYLAGRQYQMPIFLNGERFPSGEYNSSTGTLSGGFNAGDDIIITFKDNV
jgi:hypothetical protein